MIKKVIKRDLMQAAKIHSASWKMSHKDICSKEFLEEHTPDRQKRYLETLMDDNTDIYMLVENYPVGIVSIKDNVIANLYVLPHEQNKGYGTKLLRYATNIIINNNFTPTLWILSSNVGAKRLYERNGFRESGRKKILSDTLYEIELISKVYG